MCEECRILMDAYQEATRRYSESVGLMQSALGLPGFYEVHAASDLLRGRCRKALNDLDHHQAEAHPRKKA